MDDDDVEMTLKSLEIANSGEMPIPLLESFARDDGVPRTPPPLPPSSLLARSAPDDADVLVLSDHWPLGSMVTCSTVRGVD